MRFVSLKFIACCFFLGLNLIDFNPAFAQSLEENENPLNKPVESELIPKINRELSDFERKRIREKITELDSEAQAELKAGNEDQAFAIWYDMIKLSKSLGKEEEIKNITKVGAVAWEKSRNQELNFLTERLTILEKESTVNGQISPELLPLFADGYQALHSIDKSIAINQQILNKAREKDNKTTIKTTLDKLGELYLSKFDYYQALPIYEELLNLAQTNQNYLQEGIYLRQLAEINGAILKPENAVNYKQKLVENYLASEKMLEIPFLKIAIGDDYSMLDKPQEASQSYQEAFNLAWSLEQYATAGDALKKLGKLYQDYQQLDSALKIYQELIKVEQQSYNLYGLMDTYDQIGMIYQEKEDYNQARKSWQKALEIAQNINYKEAHFRQKINDL